MAKQAEIELRAEQETMRISCFEAGCHGCQFVHRCAVGEPIYFVDGERASRAVYEKACQELALIAGSIEEVKHGKAGG